MVKPSHNKRITDNGPKSKTLPTIRRAHFEASCMDLIVPPCLPIRLPAWEAGTSSLVGPAVTRWGWSVSTSKPSAILLWTLSNPSTAGGSSASGSSFAEIITF